MKRLKLYSITPLILLWCITACSSNNNQKPSHIIDFETFKVQPLPISHFSNIATITKVIKLETTEDSLVGNIDRLIIDKNNSDILVADIDSRKKVLRFSQQGKYLTSYGNIGEAPSEYTGLLDVGTMTNSDIVLLGEHKLIKLSRTGHLLIEKKLNFIPQEMEIINDTIYVSVLLDQKKNQEKKAIYLFNSLLVNIGGIGQYDSRLEKYIYLGYKTLASTSSSLYITDYYDLGFSVYDVNTRNISRLTVPSQNRVLDSVWSKKNFTETERTKIKQGLHSFIGIFSAEDYLLLFENCDEKRSYHIWQVNLKEKEVHIYPLYNCFYQDEAIKEQPILFFSRIVGTSGNAMIAMFADPEEFNKNKKDYPILRDISFQVEDNPILVFVEFNKK